MFHAGVGSGPLDTSVRFSLQSWMPSERDEESETGSQGGAIKTLSGREGVGGTQMRDKKMEGCHFSLTRELKRDIVSLSLTPL